MMLSPTSSSAASGSGVSISDAAKAKASLGAVPVYSTTSATSDPDLNLTAITTAFDKLMERKRSDGAGDGYMARVDASRDTYLNIVSKAETQGGFERPSEFIASLSTDELQALQYVQSLAAPIQPGSLNKEGALNLLLPTTLARDIDHNGITNVGLANMTVFPPNDAPADFKAAWEKTTKGLDWLTRTQMANDMWALGPGAAVWSRGLSDATINLNYGSIDYADLLDRTITSAEYNLKHQESDKARDFVGSILEALRAVKVNLGNP